MLIKHRTSKGTFKSSIAGFTMPELLAVVFIIGILSAIAVPGWLAFINHYRLTRSIDRAYWAMQSARSNAKRDKRGWQASFRQQSDTIQWAVHPAHIVPAQVPDHQWNNLEPQIQIDTQPAQTTLLKVNPTTNQETTATTQIVRRVIFNHIGCPVYKNGDECGQTSLETLGTLTFIHPQLRKTKRCVIVSTILGAKRIAQQQPKSQGRYCY